MAKLNRDQLAAASDGGGHAVVLAGPGTGKTSTLAARHAFLRSQGREPGSVMVVTFTQRAAEGLRHRLGAAVDGKAWVGTFHGLSTRLLKRFHGEAGLPANFRILDPAGSRQVLADAGIRWDQDDGDLVDIIGRWKDSMTTPERAAAEAAGRPAALRLAAEHYASYEAELARRGAVDFADLVSRATRLVAAGGGVSSFISSRFGDVLVDEFQDANRSQAEFVSALAARGLRVWAVGDDDQALYGWRGGDVRLTVNFADRFPGARSYTLGYNYRCAPAVLAAATALISHNRTRVRKDLRATRPHDPAHVVRVRSFAGEREEASFIASEARRLVDGGMPPRAIAVLFRTASVSPSIQQALEAAGLPFALTGASSFWGLPEVSAVVDLIAAVEAGNASTPLAARSRAARDLVETMKGSVPAECAPAAGRVVGGQPPAGSSTERAALWADGAEAAAGLAAAFPTAAAFAAHVTEMSGRSTSEAGDGIAVSTIHSSKGLEWSHVFVAGVEASLMPHHRSEDLEEERRLAYVALTRSKGAVDVTMSKVRFGRAAAPSPFVAEMATGPKGCVAWVGGEPAGPKQAGAQAGAPPADKALPTKPGKPATFRRRGGKSLVGPNGE